MFSMRIVFGTIAAAGLFAAAAAAPAMATTPSHPANDHGIKPVSVTHPTATHPNTGHLNGHAIAGIVGAVPLTGPAEGLPAGLSAAGGLGDLIDGLISTVNRLLGALLGGGSGMLGTPATGLPLGGALNGLTGTLKGVTNAVPGLGQVVTGTAGVAVNGVLHGATGAVKKLPVVGNVVGNLANTAQDALGGLTGALGGGNSDLAPAVGGALSGVTDVVPGLGSLTSGLPVLGH